MAAPGRRCWVLRTPESIRPKVVPSAVVPHPVRAWWPAIQPGDDLYLWQEGDEPGIYAVGVVAGPVEGRSVDVACRIVLEKPVRPAAEAPHLPMARLPWATTASIHPDDVATINRLIGGGPDLPEPWYAEPDVGTADEVAASAAVVARRGVGARRLAAVHAALGRSMPERYPSAAEVLAGRGPVDAPMPFDLPRADWSVLTAEARQLLDMAEAIAGEVPTQWPRPGEVHLLAALLLLDDPDGILPAPGAELRQRLYDWLTDRPEHEDNLPVWRAVLKLPPAQAPVVLPRFAADSPEGRELLGRTPDVRGFARTIASATLQPPLSIGLFGDWGSGKSFFMEKVRQEVDDLTARTRTVATDPAVTLGYCERVAQVWFNAWQYSEGNIWASLVQHLFANLRLSDKEKPDEVTRRQARVLAELQSHQKTKAEAEAAAKRAEALQRRRRRELEARQKELQEAEDKHRAVTTADVWDAVQGDAGVAQRLREVRRSLGLPEVATGARELRAALDETVGVLGRGWTVLTVGPTGRDERATTRQILTVAGLALAITVLLGVAIAALGEDALGSVVALSGQVGTVLGAAAAWLRRQVARLKATVEPLESARATLDRQYQEKLEEQRKKEVAARAELDKAEAALAEARAGVAAAQAAEEAARRALEAIDTGQVLAEFVQNRADSHEYAKHLGIVALVRRDFSELSKLMLRDRAERTERRRAAAQGAVVADRPESDGGRERFELDRIVLYIDDLDRCRSEQVVRVLEAVHLLLALDLFVVIVGVDARWVSRSLKDRYPLLLGRPEGDGLDAPARADDYLEKIFQVPYWLPPMEPDGTDRLVRDLFAGSVTLAAGDVGAAQVIGRGGVVTEVEEVDPRLTDLQERLAAVGEDAFQPNPLDLLVTEDELRFMDVLSPLTGRSPRTAKRFVNVYRILKAGLTGPQADGWLVPERQAPAHAVMLLLAIVCGAPASADGFFRRWRALAGGDFWTMQLEVQQDRAAKGPVAYPEAEWARWDDVCRRYVEPARGWSPVTSDMVKEWIPRVAQYSFRAPDLLA